MTLYPGPDVWTDSVDSDTYRPHGQDEYLEPAATA